MKRICLIVFLFLLQHLSFPAGLQAEENTSGELSLPWGAFEKLLKLDQDDVMLSWEEFQRLIKQTGVQEIPNFQMDKGNVVLSRAEFKRVLDLMRPPPAEPAKHFLTKAVYSGRVGKESAKIVAAIQLQIPAKGKDIQPLRIPLFPAYTAFQDILLDNKPALIENDGNWMYVTVTTPGDHEITAVFSTPGSLEKAPHQLNFQTPRTPITQLNLTLPLRNVNVQVNNAAQVDLIKSDGNTQIKALLPSSDYINVTWNPVTPEKEKGPAKIYAVVHNLFTIEDDALRVHARVEFNVLQNTVNGISLRVPASYNVLDVQGAATGEWKLSEDRKVLTIPLQYAREGEFTLDVTLEQLLPEDTSVISYEGLQVLKAVRESGFVGVELKTTAEAKITDSEGLDRIDIQELPPSLLNLSNRPLIFGFKYLRQPYQLTLDIQRHKEVAVISTVVDEANGVTLVMGDGKRVHQFTYTVRNTWKQFLELQLPEKAQVWSAFVENQRVRPSKSKEGRLLIPLNRSRTTDGNLAPFDVEIMYYNEGKNPSPAGRHLLDFPMPDVVVSQILWSVYLPVNYDYLYFGGTVEKEEEASGFKPLLSNLIGQRRIVRGLVGLSSVQQNEYNPQTMAVYSADENKYQRLEQAKDTKLWKQRGKFEDSHNVKEEAYARQVEREINFFGKLAQEAAFQTGSGASATEVTTLPLRVNIPSSGQVYRFTKQIIVDKNFLDLKVIYIHRWLMKLFKLGVLFGLIMLIYRARGWLDAVRKTIKTYAKKHNSILKRLSSPFGLVITCTALVVVFFFISRLLFAVAFLTFTGACLRWLWTVLKIKRGKA